MLATTNLRATVQTRILQSPRICSVRCAATDSQVINKTIGKDQEKVLEVFRTS